MNKLDEFLEYLNCDCSDGGCIFRPSTKKGMVTNGGCKCSGDYNKRHELARLIRWLKDKHVDCFKCQDTGWFENLNYKTDRDAMSIECDCEASK